MRKRVVHAKSQKIWLALLIAAPILLLGVRSRAFSFSDYEQEQAEGEARSEEAKARHIDDLLSVSCKGRLRDKKVMVVIAERHSNGRLASRQSNYGLMFQQINQRLRNLGMRTYTQEEITAQIAQAQIEAFFNNDPDAAISASRRLGASFILRGLISTRSHVNPVVRINEVFVDMGFTLVSSSGRAVSDVSASAQSWAGSDTLSVALALVKQDADTVVAQLYHDYCTHGR